MRKTNQEWESADDRFIDLSCMILCLPGLAVSGSLLGILTWNGLVFQDIRAARAPHHRTTWGSRFIPQQ
jgi:hypothetical protein